METWVKLKAMVQLWSEPIGVRFPSAWAILQKLYLQLGFRKIKPSMIPEK
jgi:hypothetical protein